MLSLAPFLSAVSHRGPIEARNQVCLKVKSNLLSAVSHRGPIEASPLVTTDLALGAFPRYLTAAPLKRVVRVWLVQTDHRLSAVSHRGPIQAATRLIVSLFLAAPLRGISPRPH